MNNNKTKEVDSIMPNAPEKPWTLPADPHELLYKKIAVADRCPDVRDAAQQFCEGYKAFLDHAKTERDACRTAVAMLEQAGYRPFVPGTRYEPGAKVYRLHLNKCVLAATLGTKPLEAGLRVNIAHIDCPRLDLRPVPLYEAGNLPGSDPQLTYLRTHYYGGVRKYQWPAMPLALHGVVYRADGTCADICIGEKPEDPVFYITDLLPHLSAQQNEKPLKDAVPGENLNVLIGSLPLAGLDPDARGRVKLNVLALLYEQYGITERDFLRAELEVVPAYGARDVGLDRSMVGAYGQDDRSNAYPALMAELETAAPAHTTLLVLTDKEEIGSEGVTGMQGPAMMHFIRQLCQGQGSDEITAIRHSKCLSTDVAAAFDPNWPEAFELSNSAYLGQGVGICKYTGSRGKSGSNDAGAELLSWLTALLDEQGVVWQSSELGRVDQGGGGTIAKFAANCGIETVDIGVPVLSMHAPFEVVAKADVYMAYRAFRAFAAAAD